LGAANAPGEEATVSRDRLPLASGNLGWWSGSEGRGMNGHTPIRAFTEGMQKPFNI